MKARWVLLVVCLAACVGGSPEGGIDTAADVPDVVADLKREAGSEVGPTIDAKDTFAPAETLDATPPSDGLDTIDIDVPCVPDCEGKECGDDGCGGSCGTCAVGCVCSAEGQCLGCGGDVVLEPTCVHLPYLVGAGAPVPVAVFVEAVTCGAYTHFEVEENAEGVLAVTLYTEAMEEPCLPCIFNPVSGDLRPRHAAHPRPEPRHGW